MSTTQEQEKQTDFVGELLKGIEHVKSRDDGSVHTIKAEDGKTTVAEICHGKKNTRLNFKSAVSNDMLVEGLVLGGKAGAWAGGGCKITDENLASAKQTLDAVVASVQPVAESEETPSSDEPTVEDANEAAEQSEAQRTQAKRATTRGSGRTSRRRASAKS